MPPIDAGTELAPGSISLGEIMPPTTNDPDLMPPVNTKTEAPGAAP